jgi:hypothetical protein
MGKFVKTKNPLSSSAGLKFPDVIFSYPQSSADTFET